LIEILSKNRIHILSGQQKIVQKIRRNNFERAVTKMIVKYISTELWKATFCIRIKQCRINLSRAWGKTTFSQNANSPVVVKKSDFDG
jgi:hypothetical protein